MKFPEETVRNFLDKSWDRIFWEVGDGYFLLFIDNAGFLRALCVHGTTSLWDEKLTRFKNEVKCQDCFKKGFGNSICDKCDQRIFDEIPQAIHIKVEERK